MSTKLSAMILGAGAILLTGCVHGIGTDEPAGPTEHIKRTVDLDKSETVRVDLKMGAGKVELSGGSPNLMDADFTYNVPSWKPEVNYEAGHLRIEQPGTSHSGLGNNHEYEWDLKLNDEKPLSVNVQFGAGEANLKMGSLTLESVDVKMGVGEMKLDLRGTPKKEYQVNIRGGVGEATVYLPQNVGVVAYASGGLGEVDAKGLQKRGDRYVNEAYEKNAKVSIRLDIKGGIGSIHLIGE